MRGMLTWGWKCGTWRQPGAAVCLFGTLLLRPAAAQVLETESSRPANPASTDTSVAESPAKTQQSAPTAAVTNAPPPAPTSIRTTTPPSYAQHQFSEGTSERQAVDEAMEGDEEAGEESGGLGPIRVQTPTSRDGGKLALGIIATSVGGATTFLGGVWFVGEVLASTEGNRTSNNETAAMAAVSGLVILGGVGLLYGGIKLIRGSNGSPRTTTAVPASSIRRDGIWEPLTIRF